MKTKLWPNLKAPQPRTRQTADTTELRALRATLWHKLGVVTVDPQDVNTEEQALLTRIAARLYGARNVTSMQCIPWRVGNVIDRGDGETWTVVATVDDRVTIRRKRDGALGTTWQITEER